MHRPTVLMISLHHLIRPLDALVERVAIIPAFELGLFAAGVHVGGVGLFVVEVTGAELRDGRVVLV